MVCRIFGALHRALLQLARPQPRTVATGAAMTMAQFPVDFSFFKDETSLLPLAFSFGLP